MGVKEGAAQAAKDFEENVNDPDKYLNDKSTHYVEGFKKVITIPGTISKMKKIIIKRDMIKDYIKKNLM